MNAERFTVYLVICVGSGIGPMIFASYRSAVSMICRTDASRILYSYARTRIRSFCVSTFPFAACARTRGAPLPFAFAFFGCSAVVVITFQCGVTIGREQNYATIFVTTPA